MQVHNIVPLALLLQIGRCHHELASLPKRSVENLFLYNFQFCKFLTVPNYFSTQDLCLKGLGIISETK